MPDFSKPQALDNITTAFPVIGEVFMPAYEEIPEEFKHFLGTIWNRWQVEWFFKGLKSFPKAKLGIDQEAAIRHLKAIQSSWEPKHEHKEAAVAYLASLWLEIPEGIK